MPITTIGADNPYLQRYGGLTVSADLAAYLTEWQQRGAMVGIDPFNGVPVPQEGDSLLDFTAQLHFAGEPQVASDLATMNGIPQQDFNAIVTQINQATSSNPHGVLGAISGIGNYVAENPALLFAAPLAIAGIGGALASGAGGAGAGGAAGAAGGGGSLGGTLGSAWLNPGELLISGAAPSLTAGGIAAGLGGAAAAAGLAGVGAGSPFSTMPTNVPDIVTSYGTQPAGLGAGGASAGWGAAGFAGATGGGTAAPSVPDGYSGAATQPGPAGMTVFPPAGGGGIGLGAGALTGIGLGGAAGAAALVGGGGSAAVPQGPPADDVLGGVMTGPNPGGLGGLSGLGWPAWLTAALGGLSSLTAPDSTTSTSASAPPAFLAPGLTDAAGAAQRAYQAGNYVAPIQQSAIDYGTNVLNGNYLNSNPYLDATFNRAAGAVTNQVQSNFGRSGRDVRGPDAQVAATMQYDDLANLIYGGNYQAERDRMQQIVPQANQLGAVTNPNQSLDDYIARLRNLGGSYGTTSNTTPLFSSPAAGFLGGLFSGSALNWGTRP